MLGQYFLPPATKLGQGYVFTRVCDPVHKGGVVSQHALQVSRPTPRGEVEKSGQGRGVFRPTLKGEVKGSGRGGSPGPHPGR